MKHGGLFPLLVLCWPVLASAAESLAPPHAPPVAGLPVPVTPHPDQHSLLDSPLPELAANKLLVFNYWRIVIVGGAAEEADRYLWEDYVEHNPLLPSGGPAFQEYVADEVERHAITTTIDDLVTIVAEGPYVALAFVAHYLEGNGSGETYTSTHFELFRVDQNHIAEHWDSSLFRTNRTLPDYGVATALPVLGVTGSAQYAQLMNADPGLFANKRLAFDLWRHIPEGGREEMAELYLDPVYIQHNPNAATGREGFKEYFARRPDSAIESTLETPLVTMIAEGDLVVQVLQTEREQNGVTYQVPWFDMFRIENGRVIEHWDTASKGEVPSLLRQGPLGL